MLETDDPTLDNAAMFTATLLLKFNYKVAEVNEMLKAAGELIKPNMMFDNGIINSTKLFYLLFDNLMLLPEDCRN